MIYTSNFKILQNQILKFESNYSLNTSITHYKLLQHKIILNSAQHLNFPLGINEYQNISNKMLQFIDTLLSTTTFDKNLVQSVFFHKAIVKIKERYLVNGTYECLPHPGYFLGKTFFFDQRDYFFNKEILKSIINTSPQDFTDSSSILFSNFINNTLEVNISFDKLYSFYVAKDKFLTTIENILQYSFQNNGENNVISDCPWYCLLCGSSWGCCGNYSGCCFYAHPVCYLHDRACSISRCQPVALCLPGCVVD